MSAPTLVRERIALADPRGVKQLNLAKEPLFKGDYYFVQAGRTALDRGRTALVYQVLTVERGEPVFESFQAHRADFEATRCEALLRGTALHDDLESFLQDSLGGEIDEL